MGLAPACGGSHTSRRPTKQQTLGHRPRSPQIAKASTAARVASSSAFTRSSFRPRGYKIISTGGRLCSFRPSVAWGRGARVRVSVCVMFFIFFPVPPGSLPVRRKSCNQGAFKRPCCNTLFKSDFATRAVFNMTSFCCNPWDSLFNLPVTFFIHIHRFLFDASSALLLSIPAAVLATTTCTSLQLYSVLFSDHDLDIHFPVCPVLFMHTVPYICTCTVRIQGAVLPF